MGYALNYAPHLGYWPPDRPLFRAHAGQDPANHVRFAADEGMAGIFDPWAMDRMPEQRRAIVNALAETGLQSGCIVGAPMARMMEPLWTAEHLEADVLGLLNQALDIAGGLGSNAIAVLLVGQEDADPSAQWRRAIDRLRAGADIAGARGAILAVEPIATLPGSLLRNFDEAVELIRAVNHPKVKLIFDTGHVYDMGTPVVSSYMAAYDDIGVLQLADMPGRVEPGGGEIDFAALLAHAVAKGYSGLIELEHDWTQPGIEGERSGLDRLRAIDAEAQSRAGQSMGPA